MHTAIAHLRAALDTVVTNEPIHRAEGRIDQADLCARSTVELQAALAVLLVVAKKEEHNRRADHAWARYGRRMADHLAAINGSILVAKGIAAAAASAPTVSKGETGPCAPISGEMAVVARENSAALAGLLAAGQLAV